MRARWHKLHAAETLDGRVPDRHALEFLTRFVAASREGERNARVFWASCRAGEMARTGLISAEEVIAIIADAAERVGLPRGEAERTARSGVERGMSGG